MGSTPEVPEHYSAHYRDFAAEVYGDVRREAFGVDVGQNSWLTLDELERFGSLLALRPSARFLDVACGSGGPTLHLAKLADCQAVGVELYEEAVATARRAAVDASLEARVAFVCADASLRLPFESESFDGLLCVDAINHLSDRGGVLTDWARLLRPGGRLLFTDPIVLTGPLSSTEIAVRASIGSLLLLPPGENERLLTEAHLEVISVDDTTDHLAAIARRRLDARANHAGELAGIEGQHTFDGRQRFFELVATLAHERRLSRFVYTALRPI
jgi:SAM-dependent methyltransferase